MPLQAWVARRGFHGVNGEMFVRSAAIIALIATAACHSSENVTADVPVATTVSVLDATDNQQAQVGKSLATPISVRVLDQKGNTMANEAVAWAVLTGSGSLSLASSTTDASGQATTVWTLGRKSGTQTITATVFNGAVDTITAVAVAGPVASMAIADGDNQSIPAGATSAPLQIQASDQYGNPTPGIAISWATTAGELEAVQPVTDSNGRASARLKAVAGTATVTATTGSGMAVNFTVRGSLTQN